MLNVLFENEVTPLVDPGMEVTTVGVEAVL